jgi:hypothetical protein
MTRRNVVPLVFTGLLLLASSPLPAQAPPQPEPPKLKLNAELVLTTDFCTAQLKRGNGWTTMKETFPIGSQLCPLLESQLPSLFTSMKKSTQVPTPNTSDADVVLVPKIGDIGATLSRKRELVIELEWTALDRAGKTLWVQTIQATGETKFGNTFTRGKNSRAMDNAAVQDALAKSEAAIRSAPQLLTLAH